MMLSEAQKNDFKGAALTLNALLNPAHCLATGAYVADRFLAAVADRGITACIPSKANRRVKIPRDRTPYRKRHSVENMFGNVEAILGSFQQCR